MTYLAGLDPAWVLTLVSLCVLRTGVALQMVPLMSDRMVPRTILAVVSFAVSIPVIMARLQTPPPPDLTVWSMLLLAIRESAIGLVIGLGFGAFCAGLQAAGQFIDYQTGLTFTQNIDPLNGNNVSVTSRVLEQILFAALLQAGFLLSIVDALYLSHEVWPIGHELPSFARLVPLTLAGESGRVFSLALLLSGPVLLTLFILDAAISLLNRAAPSLGVYSIALSLKSTVGLAVLAAAMPMVVERSVIAARETGRAIRALIGAG